MRRLAVWSIAACIPLLGQTTINGSRTVLGSLDASGASSVTVKRGSGVPAAAACDSASEVGRVYARSDAQAVASTLYVCSQTGAGTYAWELVQGGGGGGAPTNASYLTMGSDGTLTAERALAAGTGLTLTDGGANGNATLANAGLLRPHTKRWALVLPTGGVSQSSLGEVSNILGNASAVAPDSNNGQLTNYASAATIDSNAGWYGSTAWRTGRNVYGAWQVKLGEITVMRTWVGLSTGTFSSIFGSDTPSNHMAAFRYSTSASDTTWQCVTNNGGTPSVSNSTIAPSTSVTQLLEILDQGSQIVFKIDGTTRCTINTTLPGTGQNLVQYVATRTLEAVAKNIAYATSYVEADK